MSETADTIPTEMLSRRERVAMSTLHFIEGVGGVALIGAGIKFHQDPTGLDDLGGSMVIAGSFIGGHGVIEGTSNAFRAICPSHKNRGILEV